MRDFGKHLMLTVMRIMSACQALMILERTNAWEGVGLFLCSAVTPPLCVENSRAIQYIHKIPRFVRYT